MLHAQRKKDKVVIIGSGWGGYTLLKNIDRKKYDVAVISPSNHFLFTPLLPSTTVGTLEFRCIQEPIRTVPNLKEYFQGKVSKIDFEKKIVTSDNIFKKEKSNDIPYDHLVIACGTKTNTFNTPGIADREGIEVHFLKHLFHARRIRNRILECFERAAMEQPGSKERSYLLSFVVVGGGPTSVEFVGELHDFLFTDIATWYPDLTKEVKISIIEASDHILGSFDKSLSGYVRRVLESRKITVMTSIAVKAFDHNTHSVTLSDGSSYPAGTIVWSAGLQPVKLVSETLSHLEKGPGGRLVVDECLRIKGVSSVYALGDCAVSLTAPLPPIAQAAKQQGKHLAQCFNMNQTDVSIVVSPFQYVALGSMVTWGGFKGAVDMHNVGKNKKEIDLGVFSGVIAYFTWRSAYWGMQTSWTNKILIPMHWFKSFVFGRDISRF